MKVDDQWICANCYYRDGTKTRMTECNPEICDEVMPAVDPRDYDHSRYGRQGKGRFFGDHNCYKCNDGLLPCVTKTGICEYPRARND